MKSTGSINTLSLALSLGLNLFLTGMGGMAMAEDLTPMGAISAANNDGSIPAWDGGIKTPPAGYQAGDHHPDPYSADQVSTTISAANLDQHKDRLSVGQQAMLSQYPDFKMNIYPTHRSAAFPEFIYEAATKNDKQAKLVADGNGVEGAATAVPFPTPENGQEAIWNHLLHYRGEGVKRIVDQANVTASGKYSKTTVREDFSFTYAKENADQANLKNTAFYLRQQITSPARLAGTMILVHETLNQVKEHRHAWVYTPGLRRVRRAPNIAYDSPPPSADGLRTFDQFDMFNGAIDRYDWDLEGRKEMYVPYNSYKLHSSDIKYKDIIKPKHINSDLARYEKHRVWVVDATLKEGERHIYSRRTFYIDEDSWQILLVDNYDDKGNIWRVQEGHPINYYEVPVFWTTLEVVYDLQSGRYLTMGMDNEKKMHDFSVDYTPGDFSPSELRRLGQR